MLFLSFFSYFCSDKTKKKMEETALSGFLSGFATAYFALHAYQLFRRENSSRLQRVGGGRYLRAVGPLQPERLLYDHARL